MMKDKAFVDKFFYADEIEKLKKPEKGQKDKKPDDQKKEKDGKNNGKR